MSNVFEAHEWTNAFSEFCGTLLFQFLGGAAAANSSLKGDASLGGLVTAALGNGLALAVCIYFTADISGGHLNPAVTSGMAITGQMKGGFKEWAFYVFAQIVGAIVGAGLLWLVLPMNMLTHHSYTTLGTMSNPHPMKVFIWEFIATFTLVFTVFAVCSHDDFKSTGPLAIGLALVAGVFASGPYTGGSLNPARTLGPAIVFGVWNKWWVYMLATFFGGIVAGVVFQHMGFGKKDESRSSEYV
mmetsp:Transcript_28007/g.64585  ORF Transcript_28007/g.64585 Transcript_28007/m.64585 type:complete len:243 (+) Transcript_28007:61-789(+)|eukprot:CAMPEP_0114551750 /NCGR_PEP_ID=MMETSP0114-20121206/6767_1 /TAXON_ID=31324 /ORGANISM="Goniomonas sp, Strain m" /LENGTH=242 /DNA_ID=CAMNT_0001736599 /DNA_START=60 /DNA_END=788 /DNA_ORIENTATION=+